MSFSSFKNIITEVNVGTAKLDDRSLFNVGNSNKSTTRVIKFDVPFSKIPKVSLGLKYLDTYAAGMPTESVTRLDVSAQNVTKTQFEVKFTTWSNNRVYDLAIDYTAICHSKSRPAISPVAPYVGKKVYLKNILNQLFLRNFNGTLDLSAANKKNEQFIIEDAGNGLHNILHVTTGKYVVIDRTSRNILFSDRASVDQTTHSMDWCFESPSPNVFTIADENDKLIQGHDTYDVNFISNIPDEDQFEIVLV